MYLELRFFLQAFILYQPLSPLQPDTPQWKAAGVFFKSQGPK